MQISINNIRQKLKEGYTISKIDVGYNPDIKNSIQDVFNLNTKTALALTKLNKIKAITEEVIKTTEKV